MASEFIGLTILATLQHSHPHPPNAQIQGVVADVVNQKLYLQNVLLLWSGQRLATYILDVSDIADVEVASGQPAQTPLPLRQPPPPQTNPNLPRPPATNHGQPFSPPASQPQQQGPAFVDPAILSYAKPPSRPPTQQPLHPPQPPIQPVSPIMIADGAIPSPLPQAEASRRTAVKQSSISSIATTTAALREHNKENQSQKQRQRRDSQATAVLTEPFDAQALEDQVGPSDGKRAKKDKKHKPNTSLTGPGIIDIKDINGSLSKTKKQTQGKGKGWRQTPLIEEIPIPNTKAPRDRRRGRKKDVEGDANGWATEEATDIQDMGDFDFESNLNKFDKRRVFDDIRRDDTTADDDRLVSFNRIPRAKPGTNGGRNLHWSENVLDTTPTLDVPPAVEGWNSEAGETENEVRGAQVDEHYSSGRGSRRNGSRRPLQPQSRKGSTLFGAPVERTASPRPYATGKVTATSPIPMNGSGSVSGARASFRLKNGKPCNCVSPLQMLEVEQLCISEIGLTEDMLSENAGRSIAEAVLKSSPSSAAAEAKGKAKEVRNVLFLVGNHKSGARAVAAARHLRNRRLRVTVIPLGSDRGEDMLLEAVRKQLSIYRKGGGWVERWDEYQSKIPGDHASMNSTPQPPDVIVDALLGVHVAFDELRTDDQASAFEMIRWASRISSASESRNSTTVLSIDVPSGLSPTSGLITEAEGQLLVMNARTVVALGAPKIGLLHALAMDGAETGDGDTDGAGAGGWDVLVADIGISTAVWQKHGSRRRQGVEFGNEWVVSVGFSGG